MSLLPGIDTHWFARDEDEYLECRPWPNPVGIMEPIGVTDDELVSDVSACAALVSAEIARAIDKDFIEMLQEYEYQKPQDPQ